jgi:hypothetical protein
MARRTSRGVFAATAFAAVALLAGCPPRAGRSECTSEPPASIAFVPAAREAATAGLAYFQGLTATAGTLLGPSHAIEAIDVPAGATVDARGVTWVPPPELAGTAQRFRVRSATDPCGRAAELAWSVRVLPPIAIARFEAIPPAVSTRGTTVRLEADYSGGEGRIAAPLGVAIASGVPLAAGTISATTTWRLEVTSPAGDVLARTVTVPAQAPPAISDPRFHPPVATAGDAVTLSWTLSGTVTALVLDPGGAALDPRASFHDVAAAPGVTWTLTARNDVGDVATAAFSPVVLPRPVILAFAVSPPDPPYLGAALVTAAFEGGAGRLLGPGPSDEAPVASGVPVTVGPLRRNVQLALEVSNGLVAERRLLLVGLGGPGTWEILPGAGAGAGLAGHTATLLPDGRVLLAGGRLPSGAPGGASIWDPATGATAPGPPLLHPRSHHAAALLPDGRVLLAGGEGPTGAPVDEAELLDVSSPASAPAGAVGEAWWSPQLVVLPGGAAVLHSASLFPAAGTVLRFDPATGAFSPLATVGALGWVRSFALADGRVLLLSGGQHALTPSAILDPATGALSPTGATLRVMAGFEAVALLDGRILVLDGASPAQVFDPTTGAFSFTGDPVATGRAGRATRLAGGEVLVSGATSMRWDPATGAFRETGGMLEDSEAPLVLLPDGSVLASGGLPQRYRP